MKSRTPLRQCKPLKAKQKTAKKLNKPYESIFSTDLSVCYITGQKGAVVHHIFGAARKTLSEKYGFLLPLRPDWHEGTNYAIHSDKKLDIKFKKYCQEYYINVLGKTREEWIAEFSKWW